MHDPHPTPPDSIPQCAFDILNDILSDLLGQCGVLNDCRLKLDKQVEECVTLLRSHCQRVSNASELERQLKALMECLGRP